VAYIVLPLAVGISVLLIVTGPGGLKEITHSVLRQIGL
jgi:hypothetical protein